MKILFLCGSLERGVDGVGDYTRRLAGECIRQGTQCAIIALNDRQPFSLYSKDLQHDTDEYMSLSVVARLETQLADGTAVPVLRLNSQFSWQSRLASAKDYVEFFNPDSISLQYVPYSFNQKGIPLRLPGFIQSLLIRTDKSNSQDSGQVSTKAYMSRTYKSNRTLHIMFHELWVGLGDSPPYRDRILGYLQFCIVRWMVHRCKPAVIHSHSTSYIHLLRSSFENIERLPLFSNISFSSCVFKERPSRYNRVAFFGTVHKEWDINEVIYNLKSLEDCTGKKSYIIAMGRGGHYANKAWEKLRKHHIRVKQLGALDEACISYYLSQCDFGISATCPDLVEKSGVAAAMQAHGLPIIITRPPIWGEKYIHEIRLLNPLLVLRDDISNLKHIKRFPPNPDTLHQVANQLILALTIPKSQA